MRILFDQGTPAPLRHALAAHHVETAFERGWSTLKNGELIAAAELHAFDVFVTTDANLRYQQNLAGRSVAIVVLRTTSWPRIRHQILKVTTALCGAVAGSYQEIEISPDR